MDVGETDKGEGKRKMVKGPERVLAELEERCRQAGIKVVYDDLRGEGGLCRVRQEFWVIVNRRVSAATKAKILDEALKRVGERTRAESAPQATVRVRSGRSGDH